MILLRHWSAPPAVIVAAVAVLALHSVGSGRIRVVGLSDPASTDCARRGRSPRQRRRDRRAWLFRAGVVTLVLALVSPLDFWSEEVFWPHMLQHIVIIYLAAPLMVAGNPWLTITRGLPASLRRRVLRGAYLHPAGRTLRRPGAWLLNPASAAVAFVAVFDVWHLPAAYDLAVRNAYVHDLEHLSFITVGIWLWSQLLGPRVSAPAWPPLRKAWVIAGILFANWILAIGMAFSGTAWYPVYGTVSHHMPVMADQELAAAIMWALPMIPLGVVAAWLVGEWIRRDDDGGDHRFDQLVRQTHQAVYGEDTPHDLFPSSSGAAAGFARGRFHASGDPRPAASMTVPATGAGTEQIGEGTPRWI